MSEQEFRRVRARFEWTVDLAEMASYGLDAIRATSFSNVFYVDDPLADAGQAGCRFYLMLAQPTRGSDHAGLFLVNDGDVGANIIYSLEVFNAQGERLGEKAQGASEFLNARQRTGEARFIEWPDYDESDEDMIRANSIFRQSIVFKRESIFVTFVCNLEMFLPKLRPKGDSNLAEKICAAIKVHVAPDVTLVCGDQRFPERKVILVAYSIYFRQKLENSAENNCDEIRIDNVEPHVMEKVLGFMYTNRVDSGNSRELFAAATILQMADLKKEIECDLMNKLSVENVAEALGIFDVDGSETKEFEAKAIKFAIRNLTEVIKTDSWRKLVESHPKSVMKLFEEIASQRNYKEPEWNYYDY